MSSVAMYNIQPLHGLLSHFHGPAARCAHDYAGSFDNDLAAHRLELDALVRSGDYVATIATTLDSVSQALSQFSQTKIAHEQLERLINDLLYVERHYTLTQK